MEQLHVRKGNEMGERNVPPTRVINTLMLLAGRHEWCLFSMTQCKTNPCFLGSDSVSATTLNDQPWHGMLHVSTAGFSSDEFFTPSVGQREGQVARKKMSEKFQRFALSLDQLGCTKKLTSQSLLLGRGTYTSFTLYETDR